MDLKFYILFNIFTTIPAYCNIKLCNSLDHQKTKHTCPRKWNAIIVVNACTYQVLLRSSYGAHVKIMILYNISKHIHLRTVREMNDDTTTMRSIAQHCQHTAPLSFGSVATLRLLSCQNCSMLNIVLVCLLFNDAIAFFFIPLCTRDRIF